MEEELPESIISERTAKQNYLITEILEQNFDSDLFTWYTSSIKEANIDSWTFQELETIVKDFKSKFEPGQTLYSIQHPADESLEAKQTYLRQEIIDEGFDPDTFVSYIEKIRDSDLSGWKFEDLKQVVMHFKAEYSQISTNKSPVNKSGRNSLYGSDFDELKIEKVIEEVRNIVNVSDLSQGEHEFNSCDFDHVECNKNCLFVSNEESVRCISPLPMHKTLSSDGNIVFEPLHCDESCNEGSGVKGELEVNVEKEGLDVGIEGGVVMDGKGDGDYDKGSKFEEVVNEPENFERNYVGQGEYGVEENDKGNSPRVVVYEEQIDKSEVVILEPEEKNLEVYNEERFGIENCIVIGSDHYEPESVNLDQTDEVLENRAVIDKDLEIAEIKEKTEESILKVDKFQDYTVKLTHTELVPDQAEPDFDIQEKKEIFSPNNTLQEPQESNTDLNEYSQIKILDCAHLPSTELTLITDLKFTCGSPNIKKDSFFSKKYIEYEVLVPQFNWSVKRRYSDFFWLRSTLLITCPGSYIPPIPGKSPKHPFSDAKIKKQLKILKNFITGLFRDPNLRSSPHTLSFFKDSKLDLPQDSIKKHKSPENFSLISTIEGETICDFSEDSSLFEVFSDFLTVSESLEASLKQVSKNLIKSSKKLSQDLLEMAKLVEDLEDVQSFLNKNQKNSENFFNVKNCLVKWAAHEEIDAKNVESDFKDFWAYRVQERRVMKELICDRNEILEKFRKGKRKVKNLEEFEGLKNFYGFFNFSCKNEFDRVVGDQVIYDREHFKGIGEGEVKKLESLQAFWKGTSELFIDNNKFL